MIKIISTVIIAFLLIACDSKENGEEKKFAVEQNVDNIPTSIEELQEKVTVKKPVENTSPIQPKTFAKNIFTLTTLDGEKLHVDEADGGIIFQEHRDKVVFLLFFGYRCPPCLAEIPVLKAMVNEKHDDMEIIAIEVQRLPSEKLKSFKASKGINYTLVSGEEEENSKFISYIGGRAQWGGSIPFLVALNPKGEVKVVHVGGMGSNEFNTIYNKLSKEK